MRHPSLVSFLTICLAMPACAQDNPRLVQPAPGAATLPSALPAALTGKERLGRKWMDEQRIDNCNVPADKRGTRPRPTVCPNIPTG